MKRFSIHFPRFLVFSGFILLTFVGCDAQEPALGPDEPSLFAPVNGFNNAGTALELQWNTSPRGELYHLQLSDTPDFSSFVVNDDKINGNLYVLSELPIGEKHYWRVRALNLEGASEWSETWSFTPAKETIIPTIPRLAFPTDSTQNMPQSITFNWQAVDDATRYHLQVSLEENFIRRSADTEDVRGTSKRINGLVPTYIYFWRVRAVNPAGYGQWSPTWRLVVEDEAW